MQQWQSTGASQKITSYPCPRTLSFLNSKPLRGTTHPKSWRYIDRSGKRRRKRRPSATSRRRPRHLHAFMRFSVLLQLRARRPSLHCSSNALTGAQELRRAPALGKVLKCRPIPWSTFTISLWYSHGQPQTAVRYFDSGYAQTLGPLGHFAKVLARRARLRSVGRSRMISCEVRAGQGAEAHGRHTRVLQALFSAHAVERLPGVLVQLFVIFCDQWRNHSGQTRTAKCHYQERACH